LRCRALGDQRTADVHVQRGDQHKLTMKVVHQYPVRHGEAISVANTSGSVHKAAKVRAHALPL
jgi:hypothetical protein